MIVHVTACRDVMLRYNYNYLQVFTGHVYVHNFAINISELHGKQIMNKFVAPPTDNEMC